MVFRALGCGSCAVFCNDLREVFIGKPPAMKVMFDFKVIVACSVS